MNRPKYKIDNGNVIIEIVGTSKDEVDYYLYKLSDIEETMGRFDEYKTLQEITMNDVLSMIVFVKQSKEYFIDIDDMTKLAHLLEHAHIEVKKQNGKTVITIMPED